MANVLNRCYCDIFDKEGLVELLKNRSRENIFYELEKYHVFNISKFVANKDGGCLYELPTSELVTFLINTIREFSKSTCSDFVLELCAGNGLLKRMFDEIKIDYGIPINWIATNDFMDQTFLTHNPKYNFSPVLNKTAQSALDEFSILFPVVVCCWPPENVDVVQLCVKKYIKYIIIIGNYSYPVPNYYNMRTFDIETLSFKDTFTTRHTKVFIYFRTI